MTPTTLFALAGVAPAIPPLAAATVVLIDYQNEYVSGPLALPGIEAAVANARRLLAAARAAGARIVHVAHKGAAGGLFDRSAPRGGFIAGLEPETGEAVVEKTRPNGFSGTDLAARIGRAGTPVVVAGLMTHNCVSSTVRAALDLGYPITLVGDACATRDLPGFGGGVVAARAVHLATLAALADRHGRVAFTAEVTG